MTARTSCVGKMHRYGFYLSLMTVNRSNRNCKHRNNIHSCTEYTAIRIEAINCLLLICVLLSSTCVRIIDAMHSIECTHIRLRMSTVHLTLLPAGQLMYVDCVSPMNRKSLYTSYPWNCGHSIESYFRKSSHSYLNAIRPIIHTHTHTDSVYNNSHLKGKVTPIKAELT